GADKLSEHASQESSIFGEEDAKSTASPQGPRVTGPSTAMQAVVTANTRVRQLMDVLMMKQPNATHKVTQEELDVTFLRRYKMSRQELEVLADRMGFKLPHLCFLKAQFDIHDQDQSGFITAIELRSLFKKLDMEDFSDSDLDAVVKELDSDESGEIEFFEFVEWFTGSS
ncbi:unnamed protein product, partial [Polarella glacialis]